MGVGFRILACGISVVFISAGIYFLLWNNKVWKIRGKNMLPGIIRSKKKISKHYINLLEKSEKVYQGDRGTDAVFDKIFNVMDNYNG